MTPEEKARRKKFTSARFMVPVHKNLYPAIRHCSYLEGRSMANFIQNTLVMYMMQTHGVEVAGGVVHYKSKPLNPPDPAADIQKQIDDMLKG